MKSTGHTYACNNLTSFAYVAYAITGNGNYICKSAEIDLKKFVKSLQVNLFLAGFSHLKPLCSSAVIMNRSRDRSRN